MSQQFFEEAQLVSAFVPVDMQSGANDGDWVSLQNYRRCVIVLFKGAGTAGDDPVFTLQQATDNSGSGAKALNFTTIYEKVGTLTSLGTWTRKTQTASNTYTNTDSAESEAIIAVEVSAEELDVDNDFTHLQLQIPDVGTNAQLGCGFYLLLDPRYASDSPPSAIS